MPSPLETLDSIELAGLTVWKTAEGYQANISRDGQSWHVKHGRTPSETILALFAPVPSDLPPPPPY